MANEIKKEAILKLQDEPYLKPISSTNVSFYNLDINTAVLTFQVSKKDGPLLISEENAHSYAYFKSDNGSGSGVLDLEYKDPLNGIVTITLPTDFLQASSGTKVTGQMYITVNKWTNTPSDKSDTAVLSEFTFTVKDALINSISGETKIQYIRMFDVLKQQIQQRVHDIEEAIANGEDYVTEMKSVLQKGIETLNAIVDDGKKDIQQYINQAKQDVNATKTDAVNTMTQTKTDILKAIDDKKMVSSSQLDAKLNGLSWQKYKLTSDDGTYPMTSLANNLDNLRALKPGSYYVTNTPIAGASSTAGFATVEWRNDSTVKFITFRPCNSQQIYLMRYYNAWGDWEKVSFDESNLANIQKYKLTNDDGLRIRTSGIDPKTLNTGFYQIWNTYGMPNDTTDGSSAYWNVDVLSGTDDTKQIFAVLSGSGKAYLKNIHKGIDTGWKEITNNQTDTGWLPITIKNGYNKSTIPDYDPSYRVIDYGTHKKVFIRVGVTNLTSGKNTVASIPTELNPYKIYSLGTSTVAKIPPKVVVAGGDIEFYPNSSDNYISTDYVIYQGEWII